MQLARQAEKGEVIGGIDVVERLHPHAIADEMQPLLLPVPHRDGEHPVEAADRAVETPRIDRREHGLGIRMPAPVDAQLLAQVAEVVDLAVERADVAPRRRQHRLVPGGREIEDGQPAQSHGHAGGGIDPLTRVVGAAMDERVGHASHDPDELIRRDRGGRNESSQTTHARLLAVAAGLEPATT